MTARSKRWCCSVAIARSPQWVKIRNFGGFTGSFWQGGVGDARVDVDNGAYTITGSAYGINSSNPNKVVTTDFKLTARVLTAASGLPA